MIEPIDSVNLLINYLQELDSSFEKLSHMNEGKISDLPDYVFNKRHITILKFNNLNYFFIKVISNKLKKQDEAFTGVISSNEELHMHSFPFNFDFDFKNPPIDYGINVANANIREVGNINALPITEYCVLCVVHGSRLFDWFSIESAKKRAFNEWNNVENQLDSNYSFVYNLKKIFDKFELLLDNKNFVERRLHRFLYTHRLYILPQFIHCYFEYELFLNGSKRKADLILERETGFPALLIELENSFHKVFKNNEELAVQANHAGEQIKEWVKFIELNSENAKGKMQFLTGPKDRLVIIGRGLDCIDAMKDSKFGEKIIWTYDLLIKEAKEKWNKIILDQCQSIGIVSPNTL